MCAYQSRTRECGVDREMFHSGKAGKSYCKDRHKITETPLALLIASVLYLGVVFHIVFHIVSIPVNCVIFFVD